MNIIELAKEAGFFSQELHCYPPIITWSGNEECLERFAALVRAEERKRTVEILMEMHRKANGEHNYYHYAANEIQGFNVSAEREWVDLTEDEILEEYRQSYGDDGDLTDCYFARAVIAAWKEKNK